MAQEIIIPNLGLNEIPDDGLGEYAQDKINKITALGGGSVFAAVVPSPATLQGVLNTYEAALVKAIDGTKADTADKDDKREILELAITRQANNCAELANFNKTLFLTTGYAAKNTEGTPTGPLPAVTGVLLDYGDSAGELKISFDVMEKADNFSANAYSDALNPDGSVIKSFIVKKIGKSTAVLGGLPTGQIVFVRVRANGGSTGQGPWSDPAEKRVP